MSIIYNYTYTNYLNKNVLPTHVKTSFVHLIPEKVFELIPSKSKWNSKFAFDEINLKIFSGIRCAKGKL